MNIEISYANVCKRKNTSDIVGRLSEGRRFVICSEDQDNGQYEDDIKGDRIRLHSPPSWRIKRHFISGNIVVGMYSKNGCHIIVVAVYSSPGNMPVLASLTNIVLKLPENYSCFIIGDVNLETDLWAENPRHNSHVNKSISEELRNALITKGFVSVLPRDVISGVTRPADRSTSSKGTRIDIALTNAKVLENKSFIEKCEWLNLDHHLIRLAVKIKFNSKRINNQDLYQIRYENRQSCPVNANLEDQISWLLNMGRGVKRVMSATGNRKTRRLKKKLRKAGTQERNKFIEKLKEYRTKKRVCNVNTLNNEQLIKLVRSRSNCDAITFDLPIARKMLLFHKFNLPPSGLRPIHSCGLDPKEREKALNMKFKSSSGWADPFSLQRSLKIWAKHKLSIVNMVDGLFKREWIPGDLLISGVR